jgi:hypothetical protein
VLSSLRSSLGEITKPVFARTGVDATSVTVLDRDCDGARGFDSPVVIDPSA